MTLRLKRESFSIKGIFGKLFDDGGNEICFTLEHSYASPSGWTPKLPTGQYQCARGNHRLPNMREEFETFEVMGVLGHSGILFHVGNYNRDSEGCILLGNTTDYLNIYESTKAFEFFMGLLDGIDSFTLIVE